MFASLSPSLQALITASIDGDIHEMRVLLEAGASVQVWGASVEEVNGEKATALQWICKEGHSAPCAKILIEQKADIHVKDPKNGYSLLSLVAKKGASANADNLMQLLLDNNANVNAKNDNGSTPLLHYAFFSSKHGEIHDAQIVRILVEAKADVNSVNKFGNSALHLIASRGKSPDVMSALLAHKANPNILDSNKVFVCVCVCAREGAREGARERERARA